METLQQTQQFTHLNKVLVGKPKQVHTNHGSQFASNEQEGKKIGTSQFTEYLHSLGIQYLKARVKRPQANRRVEKVIRDDKKALG